MVYVGDKQYGNSYFLVKLNFKIISSMIARIQTRINLIYRFLFIFLVIES